MTELTALAGTPLVNRGNDADTKLRAKSMKVRCQIVAAIALHTKVLLVAELRQDRQTKMVQEILPDSNY